MKLCSAVMPTRGRQTWAAQALACFLLQDYPEKQLIILDDQDDPSFPDGIRQTRYPFVTHVMLQNRLTIPKKRNMAASIADGEIIWTLDSDDWSDPRRMSDQVELMETSGRSVVGYHSMLFFDERTGKAWKYVGHSSYAIGTSLCFTKAWHNAHPFRPHPETPTFGEDNLFMGEARNAGELMSVDAGQLMVARIHLDSTSPHDLGPVQQSYRAVGRDAIPAGFFQ